MNDETSEFIAKKRTEWAETTKIKGSIVDKSDEDVKEENEKGGGKETRTKKGYTTFIERYQGSKRKEVSNVNTTLPLGSLARATKWPFARRVGNVGVETFDSSGLCLPPSCVAVPCTSTLVASTSCVWVNDYKTIGNYQGTRTLGPPENNLSAKWLPDYQRLLIPRRNKSRLFTRNASQAHEYPWKWRDSQNTSDAFLLRYYAGQKAPDSRRLPLKITPSHQPALQENSVPRHSVPPVTYRARSNRQQ